jgi:putative membrane protein
MKLLFLLSTAIFGISTGVAVADGGDGMMGDGGMGGFGYGGFGMLFFWGLVIAAVVPLISWLTGWKHNGASDHALEKLRLRLARGEISEAELEQLKSVVKKAAVSEVGRG